ncbi:signal peptidase I [Nesterenkonia halobia]|uniref:Signal peptidase I n=1 Tax=Nesterenkonia halobia TaxID=37922 RepID=A0ABP6RFH5_9MICC
MSSLLRRLRRLTVELLLWVAALAGLAAMVLVICAHVFGLSLILFRTGSMEPTIPQGAASLVKEIPASEVAVGDVVTVDRAGRLPVTHRVTSVEDGEGPQERIITMQGDANAAEDPEPYTVTEVRDVLWSVPGMAEPIHRLSDPWVMGTVTVGAALLVGWAFWPHRSAGQSDEGHEDDEGSEDSGSGAAPARPRHAAPTVIVMLIGVVGLMAPATMAERAEAATSPSATDRSGTGVETITGEHLELVSVLPPDAAQQLTPGGTAVWELGVSAQAPSPGAVRTGLSLSGQAPLAVVVESCAEPWGGTPRVVEPVVSRGPESTSCASGRRTLLEGTTLFPGDEDRRRLDEHPADEQRWLRLQVSLPEGSGDSAPGLASRLRVHVVGEGESISVSPDDVPSPAPDPGDGQLATTGAPLLIVAAAGMLSLGIGRRLMMVRTRRAATDESGDGRRR